MNFRIIFLGLQEMSRILTFYNRGGVIAEFESKSHRLVFTRHLRVWESALWEVECPHKFGELWTEPTVAEQEEWLKGKG